MAKKIIADVRLGFAWDTPTDDNRQLVTRVTLAEGTDRRKVKRELRKYLKAMQHTDVDYVMRAMKLQEYIR